MSSESGWSQMTYFGQASTCSAVRRNQRMSVGSRDPNGVAPPAEVFTLAGSAEYVVDNLGLLLTFCTMFAAVLVGPERVKALRQRAESAIGKSLVDSVFIAFVFAVVKNMFAGMAPHQTRAGVDMRTRLIRLVLDAIGFVGSVSAICIYRASSVRAVRLALLAAAAACAAWAVTIALRNLSTARLVILAVVAVGFGAKVARKVSRTNIAAYRLDFIKEGLVFVSGNLGMSTVVYKFGYPQDYASDMELARSFSTATMLIVCWSLAFALKVAVAPLLNPDPGATMSTKEIFMTLKKMYVTYDIAQNLASYSIAAWCSRMTEFRQGSNVVHGASISGEVVLCCFLAVDVQFLAETGFNAFEERVRKSRDVEQQAEKAAEEA